MVNVGKNIWMMAWGLVAWGFLLLGVLVMLDFIVSIVPRLAPATWENLVNFNFLQYEFKNDVEPEYFTVEKVGDLYVPRDK